MTNILPIIFYCSLYAVLNITGATLIKKELLVFKLDTAMNYVYFLFRPFVMLGFSIILMSAIVMFKALSLSKFSLILPISTGINFVLALFIGTLVFQERLNPYQYLGVLCIMGGIALIAYFKH